MGLGKLGTLDFGEPKNNVKKIQGPGVGLAASPLLSLLLFFVCKLFIVFFQKTWAGVAGACLYFRCIY